MINPIATESEAINSATYVDNYIDSVENLPDDVQRQLSRIRDIDVQYRGLIRDVDHYYDLYLSLQSSPDAGRRSRSISRMHQSLIQAQELGDEKMQIVNHMQEIIDGKLRQLDTDQQNLDLKEERDRYATLLEDGQPSKLQRLQSPMREQANQAGVGAGNGGLNGNGLLTDKASYALGGYAALVSGSGGLASGNGGSSTPNSERSERHVSNGGNNGSNGNISGGAGGDLQRTGSKRSRRRNESLANNGNSLEMGGNESNSANEAGGSGSGGGGGGSGSGERKSSLGGGSVSGQGRKSNLQVAVGSLASGSASTSSGVAGGGASGNAGGGGAGGNNSGKKKKRKVRGAGASNTNASAREETPPPETIDPDEPTYCVCNQISFGEMILCDNDLCPIEWFHFSCVSLVLKPKGKWFCPNCRGERPNVMKPKAQFLKELERYNKEKEEKT
ncbi:inhibitor of growth protein 1 [Drosophila kikkawai]|uniref:Inhibitor of growth protein n=1 Tax=Drosophila kikkawai TaxID=30033 RepID=A0A6P4I286_DROKI|nr:inhibitor of growth protein 2 [Drosophila kikkawai]